MLHSKNYNYCTLSYEWTDGGSRRSNNANCLVLPNYEPVCVYICNRNWTLTKRDRKQLNIFERKVYRRILGPVYENEKRKLEDINQ
jgi:hypothetical protein